MLKKAFIILIASTSLLIGGVLVSHIALATTSAETGITNACNIKGADNNPYCVTQKQDNSNDPLPQTVKKVTTVVATIGGVIAVSFVIYGGFRYVVSSGEPQKVASARNTIIYALVGVLVIVMAQVIIIFVINHLL